MFRQWRVVILLLLLTYVTAVAADTDYGSGATGLANYRAAGYPVEGSRGYNFPEGECTWFVAAVAPISQVPWNLPRTEGERRDAYKWYDQAQRRGLPTGSTPALGAILCMNGNVGGGFGHVALVLGISGNTLTVADANWIRAGHVGIHQIHTGTYASSIQGYTYRQNEQPPVAPVLVSPEHNTWLRQGSHPRFVVTAGGEPHPTSYVFTVWRVLASGKEEFVGAPEEAANGMTGIHQSDLGPDPTGEYWWTARGIRNGVQGPDQFYRYRVRVNKAPETPALLGPEDGAWVNSRSFSVAWRPATDPFPGPGVVDYAAEIRAAAGEWRADTGGGFRHEGWGVTVAADGDYYWRATAADGLDVAPWSGERRVRVDTVAPGINASPEAPANGNWFTSAQTFQWAAADERSGLASVSVTVDDGAPVSTSASGSLPLPEGTHAVKVTARDVAGNTSVRVLSYRLDSRAPETALQDPKPTDPTSSPTATFTAAGTDTQTEGGQLRYRWRLDGGNWTLQTHATVPLTQLAPGRHTFEVAAVDLAGNVDPTPAAWSWTVSAAATLTVTAPNGGEAYPAGSRQTITWTSSGLAGNVRLEYRLSDGAAWATLLASTANDGSEAWTVPSTPSTTARVRVSAVDGSVSDTSNVPFTITAPPALNGGTFALGSGRVASGSTTRLPLTFTPGQVSVTAAGFDLLYDPAKLASPTVTKAGLPPDAQVRTELRAPGRLGVLIYNTTTAWSGGVICQVEGRAATGVGSGTTTEVQIVHPEKSRAGADVSDAQGNAYLAQAMGGTVTFGLKGDLNGNGRIDVGDVQLIVNVFFGGAAFNPAVHDLNGSGGKDVGDVQVLVSLFLGAGQPGAGRTALAEVTLPGTVASARATKPRTVKLSFRPGTPAITALGFDLQLGSAEVTSLALGAARSDLVFQSQPLGGGRYRVLVYSTTGTPLGLHQPLVKVGLRRKGTVVPYRPGTSTRGAEGATPTGEVVPIRYRPGAKKPGPAIG